MKRIRELIAVLLLSAGNSACVHEQPGADVPTCSPGNLVSWEAEVSPVIHAKCAVAGCHNGSNSNLGEIKTFAETQGNAADILTQLSNRAMPPSNMPQLTPVEKAKIECWINQGAKTP